MPEASDAIEREIWIAAEEFRRALRLAFPDGVTESDGLLHVRAGPAALTIGLSALPSQTTALLKLPRIKVSIRVTAGTAAQRQAMLAHMDLAMHRGGG